MHTKKQIGRVIGIILSLFLLYSLEGRAQEAGFTVDGEVTENNDYTYDKEEGVLTVKTGTPITIKCESGQTNHRIVVNDGVNANITLINVHIESEGASPFDIQGSASVKLTLWGNNTLQVSSGEFAALHCGSYASLTIEGGGNLTATGGFNSAGIGGGSGSPGGNITISGGIVTATGSNEAAGIGGGSTCASGNITISGGIVTATGGDSGGAGIGKGNGSPNDGSFTTNGGNAFIQATSISDKKNQQQWSGVIFEGNTGKVYGKSLTLPKGKITIPSGKTLIIDKDKTLTIGNGTTLTNNGVIEVKGTLTNNGVIEVAGTLTNNGTYQGSGELNRLDGGTINCNNHDAVIVTFDANAGNDLVSNLPPTQIIVKNTELTITDQPTRTNYTLVGWSTTAIGSPITNWSNVTDKDIKFYALWKRNTKLEFKTDSYYSYTYGDSAPTVEATVIVEGDNPGSPPTETISYSYYSDIDCMNLLSSIPTDAGTYYVKASYPGDNNHMEAETAAISYKITKKDLTITPTAGQTIYSDEKPAYTVSGAVSPEKPAFTGKLGVNEQSPKKITEGDLTLADGEDGFKADNYTLMLSSTSVGITVKDQTLKEAVIEASSLTADWMKDKVTLKAPDKFKIAAVSPLRSAAASDWKSQIEIEKAGEYEFICQLKRDGATATPVYTILIPIKLDNIIPTINVTASNLSVTVDLSDDLSGLASCTYNWDNGGEQSVTLTPGEKTKSFTLTGTEGSHPLKVILTDQVGNETTYESQVTLKENRPTPPPTPTPIYYTVTLPAVEGAITDPVAGDHPVESWGSFSFTLTLDADYSESVPLVTVDGTVLTPRESDGKYIIKWVRYDMAVEISGIVKNTPTGTDDIKASAVAIRQSAGVLRIDTPQPLEGKIYSAAGTELRTLRLSAGSNRVYGLPQGVCIIRLSDGTTRKVIIATH